MHSQRNKQFILNRRLVDSPNQILEIVQSKRNLHKNKGKFQNSFVINNNQPTPFGILGQRILHPDGLDVTFTEINANLSEFIIPDAEAKPSTNPPRQIQSVEIDNDTLLERILRNKPGEGKKEEKPFVFGKGMYSHKGGVGNKISTINMNLPQSMDMSQPTQIFGRGSEDHLLTKLSTQTMHSLNRVVVNRSFTKEASQTIRVPRPPSPKVLKGESKQMVPRYADQKNNSGVIELTLEEINQRAQTAPKLPTPNKTSSNLGTYIPKPPEEKYIENKGNSSSRPRFKKELRINNPIQYSEGIMEGANNVNKYSRSVGSTVRQAISVARKNLTHRKQPRQLVEDGSLSCTNLDSTKHPFLKKNLSLSPRKSGREQTGSKIEEIDIFDTIIVRDIQNQSEIPVTDAITSINIKIKKEKEGTERVERNKAEKRKEQRRSIKIMKSIIKLPKESPTAFFSPELDPNSYSCMNNNKYSLLLGSGEKQRHSLSLDKMNRLSLSEVGVREIQHRNNTGFAAQPPHTACVTSQPATSGRQTHSLLSGRKDIVKSSNYNFGNYLRSEGVEEKGEAEGEKYKSMIKCLHAQKVWQYTYKRPAESKKSSIIYPNIPHDPPTTQKVRGKQPPSNKPTIVKKLSKFQPEFPSSPLISFRRGPKTDKSVHSSMRNKMLNPRSSAIQESISGFRGTLIYDLVAAIRKRKLDKGANGKNTAKIKGEDSHGVLSNRSFDVVLEKPARKNKLFSNKRLADSLIRHEGNKGGLKLHS